MTNVPLLLRFSQNWTHASPVLAWLQSICGKVVYIYLYTLNIFIYMCVGVQTLIVFALFFLTI